MTSILSWGIDHSAHRLRPEMFSLPPLARYLLQFPRCIAPTERQALQNTISENRIDLFAHGTTNHAIMQASSWYLLAQAFPGAAWTDIGGTKYSSIELMRALAERLLARQTAQLTQGFDEQFSPTYAIENFFSLLNLVDLATDNAITVAAEAGLIQQLAMLYSNSFHGLLVPPLGRNSHLQTNSAAPRAGMDISAGQHLLWYYSGEPTFGRNDFFGTEPLYIVMLALSNWQPPQELSGLLDRDKPSRIRTVTPSFSIWGNPGQPSLYGKAFVSDDFAIGLGNFIFNPAWYNEDTNNFSILVRSPKLFNYIQCYHPFWRSNEGPGAWLHDQSSPFMEGDLQDDRGALIFSIPDKDPWPQSNANRFFKLRNQRANALIREVNCRFPTAIDEVRQFDKAIFLREGATYVGLRIVGSDTQDFSEITGDVSGAFRNFRISGSKVTLYFRVGLQRELRNFDDFQKAVMREDIRLNEERNEVAFRDREGTWKYVRYELEPYHLPPWISAIPRISDETGVTKSSYLENEKVSAGSQGLFIRSFGREIHIRANNQRIAIDRK
ncbi:hypothetical protein ML401_06820 [Bradyrhizobium sp. 62B]|uniref:hypothetical protein n=2 Tax=Pseudomonadota TaxID=1224 RepID=UPI002557F8FE|nr:hypothetical protein ML401_06820 [Bradyrhizobium sp. 62B]